MKKHTNKMMIMTPRSIHVGNGVWKRALEQELVSADRVLIVSDHPESADRVSDLLVCTRNVDRAIVTTSVTPPKQGFTFHSRPDAIVAIGGGHAMDVSKWTRALYENPHKVFRNKPFATLSSSTEEPHTIRLICMPVPSLMGTTGSEMTPFATTFMNKTRVIDRAFLPDVAIVDADLVESDDVLWSGMDALAHAIESYTSEFANDYTQGHSLRAARILIQQQATVAVHHASSLAGLGIANAWNGHSDSIALTLMRLYQVPPGVTNAIVLPFVIRDHIASNLFVQQYAELAVYCGLTDPVEKNHHAMAEDLAVGLERLRRATGIPDRLREVVLERIDVERVALLACYDSLQFGFVHHSPSVEFFKKIISKAY
jgi:alcohol dehydrogenase class IV